MPRFYLTTAIDYVNSRPHLGTAYEKIAADVIARYKRLAGFESISSWATTSTRRTSSARRASSARIRWRTATGWRPSSCDVWRRLDISFDDFIRTTEPRHARACRSSFAGSAPPATSTRATTRAGTACPARPSSRRRTSSTACARSTARSRTGSGRRTTSSGCRSIRRPLLKHFADQPDFLVPDVRRNEILRLLEAGLEDISVSRAGQSWGIPMPQDPVERRLRLVRRAHQLHLGGGLRHRRRAVREVVAGGSARHRQGHHAVPLRSSGRRC